MSPVKIKMCPNCVCGSITPNYLVSICPNWSCYRRWPSARLNNHWGITERIATQSRSETENKYKRSIKVSNRRGVGGETAFSRVCGSANDLQGAAGVCIKVKEPHLPQEACVNREACNLWEGGCFCNPDCPGVRGCTQVRPCVCPWVAVCVHVYTKKALGLVTGSCLEISSMVHLLHYWSCMHSSVIDD